MFNTSKTIVIAAVFTIMATLGGGFSSAYATVSCPNGDIADSIEQCPVAHDNEADPVDSVTPINEPVTTNNTDDTPVAPAVTDEDNIQPIAVPRGEDGEGDLQPVDPENPEVENDVEECDGLSCVDENLPMYIAFGALGFTILFVIIINLAGRKQRK